MADQKISELTALTGANVADDDAIAIVDTSATETKKIVFSELKSALDTATGFVRITGDTMTGALDVQSTITSDGLTVDGAIAFNSTATFSDGSEARFGADNDMALFHSSGVNHIRVNSGIFKLRADDMRFTAQNGTSNKLTLDSNGDISFYEDTGTTAKFFWDASAESLGIGTSSPYADLHVTGTIKVATGNAQGILGLGEGSGSTVNVGLWRGAANAPTTDGNYLNLGGYEGIVFATGAAAIGSQTERMRITSGGTLQIAGGGNDNVGEINMGNTAQNANRFQVRHQSSAWYLKTVDSEPLVFGTANSERMRIDSSGNLLVGGTSAYGTSTFTADSGGQIKASASTRAAIFNRHDSDGDIVEFRKADSTVGSIGNFGNYMYLASQGPSAQGVKITDNFIPATTSGANNDNAMDLGGASVRWDDVYATNGTIQTSDRNEKQDIAELSEAEQRVAVAAKGLLRKFRWKDAVAEKGDEARTHFGIIAQDLQAAFAAEGLDSGDYAMFISSTWTDEETGEERTRMGVRYSELLAFIIAAI